jgi:hypothetical protein
VLLNQPVGPVVDELIGCHAGEHGAAQARRSRLGGADTLTGKMTGDSIVRITWP